MKSSFASTCILIGLILAFTGCAKPPIRGYSGPSAYGRWDRPQPQATPKDGTYGEKKNVPRKDSISGDTQTSPPASYDEPLSSIGTPPKVETSDGGDYLLAAVTPLADQSARQLSEGDPDGAQSTLERALRIDPNNADLWHLMGKIQLARRNFNQAEQMARKSNLLAGSNRNLQARNWRLIAQSLRSQNKNSAAEEAMKKARSLE